MASVIPGIVCCDQVVGAKATEAVFNGLTNKEARKFEAVARVARRKRDMVHAASTLSDLKAPPANLEALKGGLKGLHSIRVNDQFRIVFRWDDGAHDVQLTDYH